MNMKIIALVIIISILIGFGIFKLMDNKMPNTQQIDTNYSTNIYPSQTPKPALPPIDASSNLEEEINKLTPQDFSEDYKNLRDEVSNF